MGHCPISRGGLSPLARVLRVVHLGRSTCHAISGRGISQLGFPTVVLHHLFQVLDSYWRSPESGNLWYKLRQLKKTV